MSAAPTAFDLAMFDLDGTLVATAGEIGDAVNDTLLRFELPLVSATQVERWIGHGTRELLIQAVASASDTLAEVVRHSSSLSLIETEFDRHYQRRCGTRSQIYPQVRETLQALRERGVKLAVVTNKESRYTATVLDTHGLAPLFHFVVSGDSLPTKKPDPAGIQRCLAQFGAAPERALFVGDSSIDVATARNAGVRVWALPYGYNRGEPITACNPDRVIPDLSSLLT
ncbi:HAD-IA family hydrolase [Hydrogenophaga palleronii]|uniref:HAD-IA family hydrolase n=1 Tax=Hydrogenophaga palleronii TaxID=65655 RepID=UPI0008259885|nr:HAD-IA family hydrolase [Hydrogenophaga palleronii]